ncbi:hypothetical protein ACFVKB_42390 [Rhodococcus sp. NPDC127530]|uniref:hypothetical protein n=1 Tax=unclassified Rhodococcus (in: high G+C Gram-positive bacteria) TaxID=192944 RepID=UPI0036427BE3
MKFNEKAMVAAVAIAVSALGGPGIATAAAAPVQASVNQPQAQPSTPPPHAPACGPWADAPNWSADTPSNQLNDWCNKWQGQPQNGVRDNHGGMMFGN